MIETLKRVAALRAAQIPCARVVLWVEPRP
jgi:hypothetical protein